MMVTRKEFKLIRPIKFCLRDVPSPAKEIDSKIHNDLIKQWGDIGKEKAQKSATDILTMLGTRDNQEKFLNFIDKMKELNLKVEPWFATPAEYMRTVNRKEAYKYAKYLYKLAFKKDFMLLEHGMHMDEVRRAAWTQKYKDKTWEELNEKEKNRVFKIMRKNKKKKEKYLNQKKKFLDKEEIRLQKKLEKHKQKRILSIENLRKLLARRKISKKERQRLFQQIEKETEELKRIFENKLQQVRRDKEGLKEEKQELEYDMLPTLEDALRKAVNSKTLKESLKFGIPMYSGRAVWTRVSEPGESKLSVWDIAPTFGRAGLTLRMDKRTDSGEVRAKDISRLLERRNEFSDIFSNLEFLNPVYVSHDGKFVYSPEEYYDTIPLKEIEYKGKKYALHLFPRIAVLSDLKDIAALENRYKDKDLRASPVEVKERIKEGKVLTADVKLKRVGRPLSAKIRKNVCNVVLLTADQSRKLDFSRFPSVKVDRDSSAIGTEVYGVNIVTHKDFEGAGIGRKLVSESITHALAAQKGQLFWVAIHPGSAAIFEKLGAIPEKPYDQEAGPKDDAQIFTRYMRHEKAGLEQLLPGMSVKLGASAYGSPLTFIDSLITKVEKERLKSKKGELTEEELLKQTAEDFMKVRPAEDIWLMLAYHLKRKEAMDGMVQNWMRFLDNKGKPKDKETEKQLIAQYLKHTKFDKSMLIPVLKEDVEAKKDVLLKSLSKLKEQAEFEELSVAKGGLEAQEPPPFIKELKWMRIGRRWEAEDVRRKLDGVETRFKKASEELDKTGKELERSTRKTLKLKNKIDGLTTEIDELKSTSDFKRVRKQVKTLEKKMNKLLSNFESKESTRTGRRYAPSQGTNYVDYYLDGAHAFGIPAWKFDEESLYDKLALVYNHFIRLKEFYKGIGDVKKAGELEQLIQKARELNNTDAVTKLSRLNRMLGSENSKFKAMIKPEEIREKCRKLEIEKRGLGYIKQLLERKYKIEKKLDDLDDLVTEKDIVEYLEHERGKKHGFWRPKKEDLKADIIQMLHQIHSMKPNERELGFKSVEGDERVQRDLARSIKQAYIPFKSRKSRSRLRL